VLGPDGRITPAPGTRPELTPTEDFYKVDINLFPPRVQGDTWRLDALGLFERPRSFTLEELQAYPAVTEAITLSCISNPVGGDLIGTATWTGLRLKDLLDDLGLLPEARALHLKAADGFYETVEMADMQDPRTLLVYGMNGTTLPQEHGFPLRIMIPERYGMKQPKWIVSMEATDREIPGYWVDRGWSKEARPQTTSVIDAVAKDNRVEGRAPVGGIAWAGTRGIQKVEVEVDRDGQWMEAAMVVPPLGPRTWVLWRFDWPVVPGRHTFRVRATDGTGTTQTEKEQGVEPDGATGWDGFGDTFQ
jgi:DMSO/TMAO reductase YedYZ molybdopterin-dependent catalytic subunit